MGKSNVEMEDAIKGPQDVENAGEQTQKHSVDGKIDCDGKELPHSAAGGDNKPPERGTEKSNKARSHDMIDQNNSKSDLKVLKSKKSEAGDGNNMTSKEVEETKGPNNERRQEVKEARNLNDMGREEVKEVEANNVRSEELKEAVDPENGRSEGAKEPKGVNNETTGVKGEVEDRHNNKSEAKSQKTKFGSEGNEENASENGGHGRSSSEKITGDQNHSKNAVIEKKVTADEILAEPKESDNKTASVTSMTDRDVEMAEVKETRNGVNKTDQNVNEEMVDAAKDSENKTAPAIAVADGNIEVCATPVAKLEVDGTPVANHHEPAIPTAVVKCSAVNTASHSGEAYKNFFNESKMPGDEDGTPEEQAAFMKELESFYRERAMEFKPPRFYGQQLNCLKLWRAVIRLGGYDRVTGSKLWRQVGESFHPPKTCTTVSWTFRIFYEKALLEYERYTRDSGVLQLPLVLPDPSGVDSEGNGYLASGSGRARRDAAARAMQGWHAQRLFGSGEVSEPTTKDKNFNNMPKREKNLKSIGSLKQKRPNEVEHPVKAARTETSKQLVASVVDVGPPADWVKINVRETKDCFEVYALVPGLLREEVRVQSDPAGRLVITGQPEQPDNPWGITAFKKVVSLPGRIDPLQTSAVVSLHGRLFVRVPFEQSNI